MSEWTPGDTKQIFTDSRVSMPIEILNGSVVSQSFIEGIVRWIDYDTGLAVVAWETGETMQHRLRDIDPC